MPFKLDVEFLASLGLVGIPDSLANITLAIVYEVLEFRVGGLLKARMSEDQLDEFEVFIDNNDELGALQFLETWLPDYKAVVAEELAKISREVTTVSEPVRMLLLQ
jgi:hypothetical protein